MQPEMYVVSLATALLLNGKIICLVLLFRDFRRATQKSSVNPDCTRIRIILIYRIFQVKRRLVANSILF